MSRRQRGVPVTVRALAPGPLLITILATLVVAGCAHVIQGRPVSVFADPFRVAGMPATDGPSGLRSDAAPPTRNVTNTDDGDIDELARQAISDVEQFWSSTYPSTFPGKFRPVRDLLSWDARDFANVGFCGDITFTFVNAGYCHDDRTIGWDRGILLPALRRAYGDMGVVMTLAHEYGHSVQFQSGLLSKDSPTLVAEQQADCMSGAYMRWVAEGNSPRFTLSTSDGLNNVLAAVISFRDPVLNEGDPTAGMDEHGSAFERVSAFQFGFTEGAEACRSIDLREIDQRRGPLPMVLPEYATGELPVSERSVRDIVEALETAFTPADPPGLLFEPVECPDARPSPPVSYCPATNTITVDLPGLEALAARTDDGDAVSLATGDNVAYSVLMSRYMQALQREHGGVALDDAKAALRTACLTGVATTRLAEETPTPTGTTVMLTAGDIDEAVSGILTNGLAASDVNGESVPSGFARIDAFRVGVLGDEERCFKRFS
jgi:predicted metalloprotease